MNFANAPRVTIRKGRARPFWHANPIVFSGAIEAVEGHPSAGDPVRVQDDHSNTIGWGVFNPASDYRVRILFWSSEGAVPLGLGDLLDLRLEQALATRRSLGLPSPTTNAWRLVNSEGDLLSGITIDVYDNLAVVMASAVWGLVHREIVETAVKRLLGTKTRIITRFSPSMARPEGVLMSDLPAPDPNDGDAVVILENSITYEVDPSTGQKTGFYADQRDNRARIGQLSSGKRVLDLFCHTGGFSLNSAKGGAASVIGVDSSAIAIAGAQRNATRNGVVSVSFICADVGKYLAGNREMFDIVVCDPPKLASGRKSLATALQHYKMINSAAINAVAPGGTFVTCSCSSAVRPEPFIELLRDATTSVGRSMRVLESRGAAPDHVVNPAWLEGSYLKCVIATVF